MFSYPQIFYDFAIIELGAVLDNVNLLSRDLVRKSRLSTETQYRLIEHFVAGTTARCASSLVGVNRKTVAYFYHRLRQKAQAAKRPCLESLNKVVDENNVLYTCTRA